MIFGLRNAPKILGKTLQIRCFKTTRFWIRILKDFLRFGLRKRRQNLALCALLSKRQFLQKSLFSLRKIIIFLDRSLEKSTKIGWSNAETNNVEQKSSKIEFGKPFGFPKPLKTSPIGDVKQSLFCDAMEMVRKSSQVNGAQRL